MFKIENEFLCNTNRCPKLQCIHLEFKINYSHIFHAHLIVFFLKGHQNELAHPSHLNDQMWLENTKVCPYATKIIIFYIS